MGGMRGGGVERRRLGRLGDGGGVGAGGWCGWGAGWCGVGGWCGAGTGWRYRRGVAVCAGGSPFSLTGRAVSLQRAWDETAAAGGCGPLATGRVPILIAGPGCCPSPAHASAAVSQYGFRVVVANERDNIVNNKLINSGILIICVARDAITELQDAVESDPGNLLTVDVGRGDVRARGGLVARFDNDLGAGPSSAAQGHLPHGDHNGGGGDLAGRLRLAQQLISAADLAEEARIRLQRRFAAICDAVKVPGADAARGSWRLDRLLAELGRRTPGRR